MEKKHNNLRDVPAESEDVKRLLGEQMMVEVFMIHFWKLEAKRCP